METLLTYILQVNLLLVIVYWGYKLLLKNLTFYTLNRVYFVVGGMYAFVYPLVDIKSWFVTDSAVAIPVLWDYVPVEHVEQIRSTYSLYNFLLLVIGLGVFAFIFKLFIQLISLIRIHFYSKDSIWRHFLFRDVVFPVVPFSFFNRIYLHKAQHQEVELQDIFEHESIHVKGHHTWDVLLFEIILIGCWYNPFVWLMRNAVRQNLEYLTDQQVLNKGVDRQTYQYSLLNVTQHGAAVGISNQFNLKTLKKRIMMMNKKRSSRLELSKYAFLLPIMLLAGASFTVSQAESKIVEVVDLAHESKLIETNKPVVFNKVNTDSVAVKSVEYPLLAPDFDKKALEKGNFYYEIDGKLVSLDDFLAFPRTEIYAVDIYKEKDEIQKKIGKTNADGLFVMTSKRGANFTVKSDEMKAQVDADIFLLKSKYEIDVTKSYLYEYDGRLIAKDDFFNIPDKELGAIRLISGKQALKGLYKDKVSNINEYDGVVRGFSIESEEKRKKNMELALIVVDGKVKGNDSKALEGIDPNDIESMNVIKEPDGIKKYGEKGKYGVIEIKLKEGKGNITEKKDVSSSIVNVRNNVIGVNFQTKEAFDYKGKEETVATQSLKAFKTEGDFLPNGRKLAGAAGESVIIPGNKRLTETLVLGRNPNSGSPLYVVDGVDKGSDFDIKSLDANRIESISVFKGESATSLYGDKGKNGVIFVDTKEVNKNTIDKEIKDTIQKEVKETRNK